MGEDVINMLRAVGIGEFCLGIAEPRCIGRDDSLQLFQDTKYT